MGCMLIAKALGDLASLLCWSHHIRGACYPASLLCWSHNNSSVLILPVFCAGRTIIRVHGYRQFSVGFTIKREHWSRQFSVLVAQ